MKKILFAIVALFALVLAGCEKEEPIETSSSFDTLTATIESAPQTKAELKPGSGESDAVSVVWKTGDNISVFFKIGNSVENVKYYLNGGNNTTTGTFKKDGNVDLTNAQFISAVYPYTEGATYNEDTKTVSGLVMPSSYEYSAGMHTTTAPMAYIGSVNSISFKNAAALVRVSTTNVPAGYNKVELSSATSKLAGNYTIAFNSSNEPVAALTNDGSNSSSVTFTNISTNQTFFFPILPGSYTDLTVNAKGTGSVPVELVAPKALTALRNNFYYTNVPVIAASSSTVALSNTAAGETAIIDFTSVTGNTLSVTEASGANVQGNVDIYANNESSSPRTLTVELPNSTVTISGNATYDNIIASTSPNTLILGKGVTATKVTVVQGKIKVNEGATLSGIEYASGVNSAVVIDNGGNISNDVKNKSGVTIISALEADIEAAQPGETVYLTNNVKLSETLIVKKSITLDLNNYTISPADNFEYFEGDVEFFTMILVDAKESSEDIVVTIKNGTLNGGTDKVRRVLYGEGGYILGSLYGNKRQNLTLNVENLKINHANTNGEGAAMVAAGGSFNLDNKTEIITSGTYGTIECSADGVLNINGATITHNDSKPSPSVGFALGASYGGTINITSGNISSDRHCLYALPSGGILNVKGGTFNGNLVEDNSQGKDPQIYISAGTFSVDPTDYLIDGSTVQQSGTTWIVTNN